VFFLGMELVRDEERGSSSDEFYELEDVDAERVVFGREGGFEKVDGRGNVVGSVNACEDSKLSVAFEVEDVSLGVVSCIFLHGVVEICQKHWHHCGIQNYAHYHQCQHVGWHALHYKHNEHTQAKKIFI